MSYIEVSYSVTSKVVYTEKYTITNINKYNTIVK